ncbi:MAG: hypothetical protein KAU01_06750, partial [Candidatus Cloacimonetes bacterium]|nr:hypothetical protein [Candidatus Cloacimonadota bacterium]
SKEIEDKYDSEDAGRYNKLLIARDSIQNIQRIVSEARNFHYGNTLPWLDNGGRLLPAANYFDYVNAIQKFKDQYEKEVENFIRAYPALKDEAQHRLNSMYDEEDYPDVLTLSTKYSFSTQVSPVPIADDFRVTLNNEEVEAIRDSIEEQVREATETAMKDLWQRLFKVVEHMVERLKKVDNKFKNSLVNNISELCDLLPKLNITDDPELESSVQEIQNKLTIHNPQTLREDKTARSETAVEAQKILNKMRHYLPITQEG